ncbi:efflux RND transporter periplasmic adaptor subunit [Pseudotabrizicola sediminis]|uniref:Efflux RND transporter periplasmic adaptor subunit n=2 Tax=Pseudotabrizicola sediminis TaxID=2486418 RepID=A0ABY2KGZ8_9RHOB|nr:efflux RND transporter periplasmic adaptor subunit [Pseudotabrizicola sediminis]
MLPGGDGPRLPAVRAEPATPTPQPTRRAWIWAVGLGLAAVAGLGLYFQPWASGPPAVAVEIVALAPATRVLAVNGRIAALYTVDVRALVGGTLAEVQVAEGDSVERDEELTRIDAAAQHAMVRQAVAGLDAALVAKAQAADTFARTEALGGNVTRSALDAAARGVQSAEQEVARTTALVDQARVQLENYTIRAPMTGMVLALPVTRGQSIDPSTLLMTIADLDQLVVETDVDEAYATQIHAGLLAVMQLAGETTRHDGRIARVSQRVDAATGGLAVEVSFDEPVRAPVGLTVTINIIVDSLDAAITAPRAAIQTTDAGDAVFVVINGAARHRPVSVIDWPAARLIVTDGLAPSDVIILDATGITDGQAVRVGVP